MNEVSMDAMNKGWALGFGTPVRSIDADIVQAIARREAAEATVELVDRSPMFDLREILRNFRFGFAPRSAH